MTSFCFQVLYSNVSQMSVNTYIEFHSICYCSQTWKTTFLDFDSYTDLRVFIRTLIIFLFFRKSDKSKISWLSLLILKKFMSHCSSKRLIQKLTAQAQFLLEYIFKNYSSSFSDVFQKNLKFYNWGPWVLTGLHCQSSQPLESYQMVVMKV